ncbi:MAG: helix-turn-helix domain-containing protein [Anaerolineae bacterium]|nr:helix-turn-helix domain-containing protein [Anaerolineae bacterium]
MIVTLKQYLSKLEAEESVRPEDQRRDIPSITTLAKEVGISRVQLQRLVSNETEGIKFELGGNIIKSMRQRGFDMNITDLLEYYE